MVIQPFPSITRCITSEDRSEARKLVQTFLKNAKRKPPSKRQLKAAEKNSKKKTKEWVEMKTSEELVKWKEFPIAPEIKDKLSHIESYIKGDWLDNYPLGACLRKLQRDVAFRMLPRELRTGKLPKDVFKPVVARLQEQGAVGVSINAKGLRYLIFRPGSRDKLNQSMYGDPDLLDESVLSNETDQDTDSTDSDDEEEYLTDVGEKP